MVAEVIVSPSSVLAPPPLEIRIDHALSASSDVDTAWEWIVDSGASRHMTSNRDFFTSYAPVSGVSVRLANDEVLHAHGKGEVHLLLGPLSTATLQEVLFVPGLAKNLFSVAAATSHDGIEV
jgi:hypothetical protein